MSTNDLDARIQRYYREQFDEDARLTSRSAQGPLEFDRTQALLRDRIPDGASVVDIGGGTGRHAAALQRRQCVVELLDPIPGHVDAARGLGIPARVGDARDLPFPDGAFDAALLLGPLYHLDAAGRQAALSEAVRVTRPGGLIAAVGLSRLVSFQAVSAERDASAPFPAAWTELLASGTPSPTLRFPAGHFHTAEELASELSAAGVTQVVVHGVEGPAGLFLEGIATADAELVAAARVIADAASSTPAIRDQSAHLLAVGTVG
ncbi:class I SAM-dependent methyltransferase [Microbacterium gorillae]|uniref:class I SAM-dependent methyltransferase n=1 Tax=Microbacterium gorillae TaxID=1231063 RepID=UPI0005916004|nr:class I SAM-dependent methyltransferase [Microbacterium gorillae]